MHFIKNIGKTGQISLTNNFEMVRCANVKVHLTEQGGCVMKINKVMEGPRDGEVRCLTCFTRFRPKIGAERTKCPKCGIEWRLSWPYPKTAKVRGPVWETYPVGIDKKI